MGKDQKKDASADLARLTATSIRLRAARDHKMARATILHSFKEKWKSREQRSFIRLINEIKGLDKKIKAEEG